jgi:hypothetical protein
MIRTKRTTVRCPRERSPRKMDCSTSGGQPVRGRGVGAHVDTYPMGAAVSEDIFLESRRRPRRLEGRRRLHLPVLPIGGAIHLRHQEEISSTLELPEAYVCHYVLDNWST